MAVPDRRAALPRRRPQPQEEDVVNAARAVIRRCVGGFSVVAMITGWGLLALRDPHGIRPLCYGKRPASSGDSSFPDEIMVASESGALNPLGFELVG